MLETVLAALLLVSAFALRPRLSTLAVAGAGLAAGLVAHVLNRLVLAQPVFRLRIDWDSDPRPVTTRQSYRTGLLLAVLTAIGIGVVYLASGRSLIALVAFFGGWFPAYALIALLQRSLLERDFARRALDRR